MAACRNAKLKLRMVAERGEHCENVHCTKTVTARDLQVHHILPHAILGAAEKMVPDNYVLLCAECHVKVHKHLKPGDKAWEYVAAKMEATADMTELLAFQAELKTATLKL